MSHVACGGVTLFAIGAEDGVIGFGQGAANSTRKLSCPALCVV
jgi:hypothetical protein